MERTTFLPYFLMYNKTLLLEQNKTLFSKKKTGVQKEKKKLENDA